MVFLILVFLGGEYFHQIGSHTKNTKSTKIDLVLIDQVKAI